MEDDLVSQLPSDVLLSILEKLSLPDTVRVGVLSRRWRRLTAQLPRLVLDVADFLPGQAWELDDHDDAGADDHRPHVVEEAASAAAHAAVENAAVDDPAGQDVAHGPAAVDNNRDVFSNAGDEMAGVATALLASRRQSRPAAYCGAGGGDDNPPNSNNSVYYNTVSMRFYLRHNYMSLGRLLDDAVACGKVGKLQLNITTTFPMLGCDPDLDGNSIHRSLVGYGRRFKALFHGCPALFGAQLRELTLERMRHGGPDLLDDVLATCTRLEKLTLENYGPEHGFLCRVRHQWLKDIKFIMCFPRAIQLLWLPRLENFSLRGWFCTTTDRLLSLGHVPRLTALTITGDTSDEEDATFRLSRFFANNTTAAALTDLRLNFSGDNIWVRPETSTRLTDAFSKLKNLKLKNVNRECGLAWTMFLLQSAPHLQQLYIKLMEHDCGDLTPSRKNVAWEVDSSFKHYDLARVTIARFYSTQETIVTFIRRLIQAAVNLEEICFRENAVKRCSYCGRTDPDAGSKFPRTDQERDAFTKRIITDHDGRPSATAVKLKYISDPS